MELSQHPLISVVFSTRNRARILQNTLLAMQIQLPRCDWELVVVDNGSTDDTPDVLASMCDCLPLHLLYELRPGKSRAINRAIAVAKGKLVVFTDDDVLPSPRWLAEYEHAYFEHPAVSIFCGPINSLFPANTPAWLATCPHASPLFAKFMPLATEAPLPPDLLPFGGNFAVRDSLLAGINLNESLGPPHEVMGEDTDFMLRLRSRSQEIIYVPSARVDHVIRPEQLTVASIVDRAFTCGISIVAVMNVLDIVPPWIETADQAACHFNLAAALNYSYGQLYQLTTRGSDPREKRLVDHIAALNWSGEPALLSERAIAWLLQNPHHVPAIARDLFLSMAVAGYQNLVSLESEREETAA